MNLATSTALANDAGKRMPSFFQFQSVRRQEGKIGWILLWALGVPIPVLLALFLLRGCT